MSSSTNTASNASAKAPEPPPASPLATVPAVPVAGALTAPKRARCERNLADFYAALEKSASVSGDDVLRPVNLNLAPVIFPNPIVSRIPLACPIPSKEERRGLKAIICDMADLGHTALDIAGLVPMIGEMADLANAGLYTLEGDYFNAGLSAAAAIPLYGSMFTALKFSKADEVMEEIAELAESVGHKNAHTDPSAIAVAVPALAVGVVIGAVGARRYWYKGLRTLARARRWSRAKKMKSSKLQSPTPNTT